MADFTDFLRQLPPAFLAMCAFFVILLLVSGALLLNAGTVRRRRAGRAALQTREGPSPLHAAHSLHDLPDLDLLVGGVRPAEQPTSFADTPTEPSSPAPAATLLEVERDAAEEIVISQNLRDGTLSIRIGDKQYAGPGQIDDPEVRRRVDELLKALADQTAESRPGDAAQPEQKKPARARPTVKRGPNPPALPGTLPGDLPRFDQDSTPLKFRGGKRPEPVPEVNIAAAIEAYLQYKMEQTPRYAGRHIHVLPTAGGGVRIDVDGRIYEAVADIEDDETRAFLQETIAEWQARQ